MENDNNTTLPCIVVDNNKTELICIVSRQECVGFGRNFFFFKGEKFRSDNFPHLFYNGK